MSPNLKHDLGDYGETAWLHGECPGVSVELHWNLVNCASQRRAVSVHFDNLQLEPFTVDHLTMWRPTSASILLLACVHAAVGHRFDRLQLICDIVQTCRAVAGPIDTQWLREAMIRTGDQTAVRTSLALTERLFEEPACRDLREHLGAKPLGLVWNALLGGSFVVRSQTSFNKFRRGWCVNCSSEPLETATDPVRFGRYCIANTARTKRPGHAAASAISGSNGVPSLRLPLVNETPLGGLPWSREGDVRLIRPIRRLPYLSGFLNLLFQRRHCSWCRSASRALC